MRLQLRAQNIIVNRLSESYKTTWKVTKQPQAEEKRQQKWFALSQKFLGSPSFCLSFPQFSPLSQSLYDLMNLNLAWQAGFSWAMVISRSKVQFLKALNVFCGWGFGSPFLLVFPHPPFKYPTTLKVSITMY